MTMMDNSICNELETNGDVLENAASGNMGDAGKEISGSAERGKATFDDIMQPLRDLNKKEKLLREAGRTEEANEVGNEIARHAGAATKDHPVTAERTKLWNAIAGNSDVKTWLNEMDVNEFGRVRIEIQTTFDGDVARKAEMEFKARRFDKIKEDLNAVGIKSEAIDNRVANILSRGDMTDSDLNTLRGIEELKTFDDTTIAKGTSRKTYESLKNKVGKEITDDVFATKIAKNIEDIAKKQEEKGGLDKLFRKGLTNDEKKLLDDIISGKRATDANTFEATEKILEKIDKNTWEDLRKATDPLDELETSARSGIMKKAETSITGKATGAAKEAVGITTFVLGVLYGIPQTLLWFGTSTPTNIAEMTGLYEQFKTGKDDPTSIDDKLLCDDCMENINDFLRNLDGMLDNIPYGLFRNIPFYGDYIKEYIDGPIKDSQEAIKSNFKRMYSDLEKLGLVTKTDENEVGYRKTTDEERKKFYENDPEALYKTGDTDWIKKYTDGTDTITSPDGGELSEAEMTALYHYWKGDAGVDYNTLNKMGGLGDKTKDWDNTQFKQDLMEWGDENVGKGDEEETTGATNDEMWEKAVQNTLNKYPSMTREDAEKSIDRQVKYRMTKGESFETALEKLSGMASKRGGAGGSGGAGEESNVEKKKREYTEDTLKRTGFSDASDNDKKDIVESYKNEKGELDYKAMKDADNGINMKEVVTANDYDKGFVKEYVKENVDKMTKEEITEASDVDKQATADAIFESTCGGD